MAAPRKAKRRPLPEDWVVTTEWKWNNREIRPGTELTIKGERGRFRFVKHVRTAKAEWVDVVGGVKGVSMFRSFRPERVKTVHRINKTRENAK